MSRFFLFFRHRALRCQSPPIMHPIGAMAATTSARPYSRRHPHQLDHVALDRLSIGDLVRVLGANIDPVGKIADPAQCQGPGL
jgi:hypothetical protein